MVALGALLIVGMALAIFAIFNHANAHHQVLAVKHKVTAGQTLSAGDLKLVTVSADTGDFQFIDQTDESKVVGRQVAVTIPADAPLLQQELGATAPASGTATLGILCKPGQYPPRLAAGDHVQVIDNGAAAAGNGGAGAPVISSGPISAVVTAVDAPADTSTTGEVVTLQVASPDATAVARSAAAGRATLVLVSPGG